ncbi:dihydrodipicolinate synthase [Dactylonectria macrodidyma]|uniref:Dihydrodipicolinate synthase n=1 Tax=Dactylonectria macrodidyma TaxID=307937 RepID=A0A9P9INA9_9HYPO|nr:dihydrodipicolinate synthase [Dactylonectria macrodidyma]
MGSNSGTSPYSGIHVPCVTWFKNTDTQEIDWDLQRKHLEFLIGSGVEGVVLSGSNGEAVTLSSDEKLGLVRLTRKIAAELGRPELVVTLGTTGQSTQDVVANTRIAKQGAANFVLTLVPSYFHYAMTSDAICNFFEEVASSSPVPVIIYSYPSIVAGLDLNSDMLSRLGKHPNIAGVKLTCGGTAKAVRIRAEFEPSQFCAITGQSDWLVPGMAVGATGAITGVANVYPKSCARIYDLFQAGKVEEATKLQLTLAQVEVAFINGGINGTKWVVAKYRGYDLDSVHCRRPYPKFSDTKHAWITEVVSGLEETEKSLGKRGSQ